MEDCPGSPRCSRSSAPAGAAANELASATKQGRLFPTYWYQPQHGRCKRNPKSAAAATRGVMLAECYELASASACVQGCIKV